MTDERLLSEFVSGSEAAFEELLSRRQAEVWRTAAWILRDGAEAEDVAQQVFIKVYERAQQFRGDAPVRAWLRKLTVSTCIDHLRRRRVRSFLCPWSDHAARTRRAQGPAADEILAYRGLRGRVEEILDRLPARQRTIFSLRTFEEWSLAEIAQALGLEVGTVKTHLFRATHRVRAALRSEPGPAEAGAVVALAPRTS